MWFVAVVLILIFAFWKYLTSNYWEKKGLDHEPRIPIFGNFWRTTLQLEHITYTVTKLYEKYYDKQYVGVYFFNVPMLIVKDPELIKAITIKDFDHFVDRSTQFVREDLDSLFGKNLFALKGKRWHDMRSALSPAFTGSKMKFMFELISDCGEQVANYIKEEYKKNKNGKPIVVEIKDIMSRYTMDVIGTTAFGVTVNSLKERENEFYQIGKQATQFGLWRMLLISISPWLMKAFKTGIVPKPVYHFIRNVIEENIQTRERDNIVRPDMIHLLMQARKGTLDHDTEVNCQDKLYGMNTASIKNNKRIDMTDEDICAQAFVFFLAGFETSSSSISFIAYELALNPDIQKRLLEEIDEVAEKNGEKFTYQCMQQLKYMDMVIAETLRKWPQVSSLNRVCTKPYTLITKDRDIFIEKGMTISIPVAPLHHDPKYFPNPEKFDPERFNEENKHSFEQSAYMPFGIGPRICIGQRFAMLETKILLYHLLRNFEIVVTEKTEIPIKLSAKNFFLSAKNGIWLGLKFRE